MKDFIVITWLLITVSGVIYRCVVSDAYRIEELTKRAAKQNSMIGVKGFVVIWTLYSAYIILQNLI